jgi:hypothetical protein
MLMGCFMRKEGGITVLDKIKISMSELYPEDGRRPNRAAAAQVREELLGPSRKTCKEVSTVFACLDGIMRRARFDAVSKDAEAREKAEKYFISVRESGTPNEKRLAADYLCDYVRMLVRDGLGEGAGKKTEEQGGIEVSDGKGNRQIVEAGDAVKRTAQMLLVLGEPKAVDVLFEAAKELGSHRRYAELGEKVGRIAERLRKDARKEAAAEFSKHRAE